VTSRKWTAHDVLVFTFRDNFPDKWLEADDFADEVIAALADHHFSIEEES
jgi:hypothetical protein